MAISKKRQKTILEFASQGGTSEIGPEIWDDEKRYAVFKRELDRNTMQFVETSTDARELHLFAQNWDWDGNIRPLFKLIKNPHCDAGTLLFLYWHGCPEDYYLFHSAASDIEIPCEREVFRLLRQIERKIVKAEHKTSSIAFDPTNRISMRDRRDEFARAIPEIMYQPVTGRKKRGG